MAWPNNNFNSFWEAMSGPNGPPHHPPHGAGVDHAPPPPPGVPPFMNPDFWNRWSQQRPGWESFAGPSEGRWGHGPHGRHAHAHGRRRGGRGGRHGRNSGEDEPERGVSAHEITDDEAFPPEYISDEEVAAATAAAEAEKKGAGGEKDGSPDTMMQDDDAADPPEEIPNPDEPSHPRHHGGRHGRRGGRGGFAREGFAGHHHKRGGPRGGPRGAHHRGPSPFGLGGEPRRRSRGPHGHHHGPPPPPPFFEAFFGPQRGPHGPHGHHHRGPPPPPTGGAFDLRGLMAALANHPAAQQVREYIERMQQGTTNNEDNRAMTPGSSDDEDGMGASFSPPLDLFELADRWVLHLAVPGAKKEDVGVNWDGDRSILGINGVVYRPGDEQFLQGLVSGERSVGLFSREVRLPPAEKRTKEEVNSDGIEAKMEEGVLVITVPKVEKDWTEVKRVEIQ